LRVTFNVEVNTDRADRQIQSAKHVNLFVPDGERLQSGIVGLLLLPLSLAFLAKPEGVGQLSNGEDPFPFIPLNLFLTQAPEKAEVVFGHRLGVAAVAELTHRTVAVER